MGGLKELTDENFKDFVAGNDIVAVDFWAQWCGPCAKLTPIIEELADEMSGIRFAKLSIDDNKLVANEFGIRAIPCILVFKNGRKVGDITGFRPKESLKTKLEEYL